MLTFYSFHLFLLPSSSIFSILCPDKSTLLRPMSKQFQPCFFNLVCTLLSLSCPTCSSNSDTNHTWHVSPPNPLCLHTLLHCALLWMVVPPFFLAAQLCSKIVFCFFSSNNTWTEIYLLRQQCSNCLCFSTEQEILPYHQVSSWCTLHWQQWMHH